MKKVTFALVLLLSMALMCPTHAEARGGGHGGGCRGGGFRGGGMRYGVARTGGVVGYAPGGYYGTGYYAVPAGSYGPGCYQDCAPVYDSIWLPASGRGR